MQTVPVMVFTKLGQIYLKAAKPVQVLSDGIINPFVHQSSFQLETVLTIVCETLKAAGFIPEVHYLSSRDHSLHSAPFALDLELYTHEGLPVPDVDFNLEYPTLEAAISAATNLGLTDYEVINCWANTVYSSRA